MKIVYSDRYSLDIGAHVFPTAKYFRIKQHLVERGIAAPGDFVEPAAATWDDIALVHTEDYLDKLRRGLLSLEDIAQMEIPWSPAIVEGFRLMVGGTIETSHLALDGPRGGDDQRGAGPRKWHAAVHLGGGFHHAYCNHGEGFCMFNDVAIAIRRLKRAGAIKRAAIIDCDVHHGNGTAAIFTGDPTVFTFSIHQLHNYPAFKPAGSLDIALDDWTGDEEYLAELSEALPRVFASRPDIIFFLAGADPYKEDQLGGLRMTREGLRARDRLILEAARSASVPVAVTLAGGYAHRVEDTIAIHVATVEETKAALERGESGEAPGEC